MKTTLQHKTFETNSFVPVEKTFPRPASWIYLLALWVAMLLALPVRADFTWVGAGDPGATNNWDDANNWNYEGYVGLIVPGQDAVPGGDQTHVNDGGYALISAPLSQPGINEIDIGVVSGGGGIVAASPTFSDGFEAYADGAYTTSFGSWTVLSNQVFVTSTPSAYEGANSLALTNGGVSITLPTVAGNSYMLQYACQGVGVKISGGLSDTFVATNTYDWEVHQLRFVASSTGTAIQLVGVTNSLYSTLIDAVALFDVQYVGTVLQTAGTLNVNSWFNLGANGAGGGYGTYDISGGVLNHVSNGNFDIGAGGVGLNSLIVHGSGVVTNSSGPVLLGMNNNKGTNILTVADTGTFAHTITSDFNVGDGGAGCVSVLTVSNSATFYSKANFFGIAHSGGNLATLNLYGGTMTHAGGSQLSLGQGNPNALGTLNVNGGALQIIGGASILVGDGSSSTGIVNIASGIINHSSGGGTLNLGSANVGTINQTGGFITNTTGDTLISSGSHGRGTWNISGGVAQVNFSHIGNGSSSNATLNVSGTGLFISQQTIEMGASGSGTNVINLNGGTLAANGIQADALGTGLQIINFNGGVLKARVNNGNFLPAIKPLQLNVLAGGAIFDNSSFAVTITNALSGAGGFTKQGGSGALTLSGANTYSGPTFVNAGELINPTAASSVNSRFDVAAGATNGVQITVANGQWTCAGLTNEAGSYADFNFGAVVPSASIAPLNISGDLVFNGTLNVIIRGTSITNTGTYPLIKYGGNLSGTPPASAYSLPSSILTATLVNNTGNKSIDLNVSAVTVGPLIFAPTATGAVVGSNAVTTLTVPAAATSGGSLTLTLTSGNTAVTASQMVILPQGITSTNVSFPILAVGVSTVTASGPSVTPASVQVTGSLPYINLPLTTGAIVGSNAVATMTLTNPYPFSEDYTVMLTSDNTAVTASQSVTLPSGVTITNVSFPILGVGVANVTASGTGLNPATIQVNGAIPSIILPASATGDVGSNVVAVMTLSCPYPFTGPYTVSLTSGNTSVTPSQTVTLPAGIMSTNLSFALLSAGLSTITASGPGLNSTSMTVGDTASVYAVGMASQWVGDDYTYGNPWIDRVGGVGANLDGNAIPPVSVVGGFYNHNGVQRDPTGGSSDAGFSIPGANPPSGYTNYTVSVVLYSKAPGPGSGDYYGDQLIVGYDIGGGGQADWGMSWGAPNNGGQGVSVGIGRDGGDSVLSSTNALTGSASHAIAMQTSGNNAFRLYVDGTFEGQITNLSLHAPNPTAGIIPLLSTVGANISSAFTNMIAEVRIYTNSVDGAALTAYLQNQYMALPISLPASISATVGSGAMATLTVPTAATANGPITVTLTSDNSSVTASQSVYLPQGVVSTNLNFPILAAGVANVTAADTGLIAATVQITGISLGSAVWSGAVNNIWDINNVQNWLVGGNPGVYLDSSPVLFDDTGSNPNVSIALTVAPESVTVSNSVVSYSFIGAGIAGNGGLLKNGGGTLTFSNANLYGGSTVISNGTLRLAAPAVMPSGTVAYYSFDNAASYGTDSSGQNNTLVPATGTPAYSASGVSGGALYLDGASTMNTGGGFPTGVPTDASPYTIAVWERVDAGAYANGGIMGWGTAGPNLCNNVRLNGNNSVVNYWFANDFAVSSVANPYDGNWHSIVATWDGTTNSIYVDGVLAGSRTPTAPSVAATGFVVGKTVADGNFKGWMDNLMIVNRALTPAEVEAYQAPGGALPAMTSVKIHGSGVLAINGNNQTVGSLSGDSATTVTLGGGSLTVGGDDTSTAFAGIISGAGSVIKAGSGTLTLSHANTYTGGTTVSSGILDVQADGGLGGGNVSVGSGASLKLELGSSQNYISDTATLDLAASAAVNLAFTGTDTITNLVIGGVVQAVGTWGSSASGAANVDNTHFSGTGKINVTGSSVLPPPSPTILPVHLDGTGTNLVLSVMTVSGYNYYLESTTNLTPPVIWSTNSTTAGTGGTITNTAPISSVQPKMFFRYLVQ